MPKTSCSLHVFSFIVAVSCHQRHAAAAFVQSLITQRGLVSLLPRDRHAVTLHRMYPRGARAFKADPFPLRMTLSDMDQASTSTPLQLRNAVFEELEGQADAQRQQFGVSRKDVLQGLNPAQQQAVSAPVGPMLVLAGPGSGKTRVLTHRVGYLLAGGESASSILTVTFTNKAANEMRKRIKTMLGIKNDSQLEITVGTFHGVCMKILRQHGERVELSPTFMIFDASQQKELVEQAMVTLNWDTEKFKPAAIRAEISRCTPAGVVCGFITSRISSDRGMTVCPFHVPLSRTCHTPPPMGFRV